MSSRWIWNRLLSMSLTEVFYRFRAYVFKKYEKLFSISYYPKIKDIPIKPSILPLSNFPFKEIETLRVFNKKFDYYHGFNWHQDISSGKIFPRKYSKEMQLKDPRNGDVKYLWEVNRMLFLPNICLKYRHTEDIKHLSKFVEITESWIDNNPYLVGANWSKNIEVSIRLINWALCWEILEVSEIISKNSEFKTFIFEKWIPSIYLHCKFSYTNPSLFSSANNHLISEIAALFIASSIWKFPEASKWNAYSKRMLEKEIVLQHSPMGVNREEASGYIQFSTDFLLLSFVFGKNSGNDFSEIYQRTLKNIFYYIFHLMDINGNIFNYGDYDDGRAFMLESEPDFNNFRSLLTSGAILFQDATLKLQGNRFDSKNEILLGSEGKDIFEALTPKLVDRHSKLYCDAGHHIFRKENGGGKEILLHFDTAPLGYLSIAAHGHADALSLTLNVDGSPIFIDVGTYTYRSSRVWRNYFIGTLAHNTIRVDEIDQARSVGPTLWMNHYQVKLISSESTEHKDEVKAQHNGYLSRNVTHTRTTCFDKILQKIKVTDQIEISDDKDHIIEIPWHIGPQVKIENLGNNHFCLRAPNTRNVWLKLPSFLPVEIIKGRENPILGWYSVTFESKQPCEVIYSKFISRKSLTLEFEIEIN